MEGITRPDPQSRYYNSWVIQQARRKKEKRRRRVIIILLVFLFVVFFASVAVLTSYFIHNGKRDILCGRWMYDSVTGYEFDGNGKGTLIASERRYSFDYQTDQNSLILNFTNDDLQDVEYEISVSKEFLDMTDSVGGQNFSLRKVK